MALPSPTRLLILVCLASRTQITFGEKLSLDQRAPLYAQGAGGLRLEPPLEGPVKTYPTIVEERNRPNFGDGEYAFSFKTADGVQREEEGRLKTVNGQKVTVVKGRYSYTSPDGLAIDVKYSADENGARSSFRFGTDPGSWQRASSLPAFPRSLGDKGKLTGREYLPPSGNIERPNNEYLPHSSTR